MDLTFSQLIAEARVDVQTTHLPLHHRNLMLQGLNLPGVVVQAVRPTLTFPEERSYVLAVSRDLPLKRLEVF